MEPVSPSACEFFNAEALGEFSKPAENECQQHIQTHSRRGHSSMKKVMEMPELLSLILSHTLLEANGSERIVKHRVKSLVKVNSTWREIIRNLLYDENIFFHSFYPMFHSGPLRAALNGLRNGNMLPVKIHLSGEDLNRNTVRKFLFRYGGDIIELRLTSNFAQQVSVDVFSKCLFRNLRTLRICVTIKNVEASTDAEDVSPTICSILATSNQLIHFSYHNIGDGKLCDKGFTSQVVLPKSLKQLDIFTHRLDTITSNLARNGLPSLTDIQIAYVSGFPACNCPSVIPANFLSPLLRCSSMSLKQASICGINRMFPICVALPTLPQLRNLTLRNLLLQDNTETFNFQFPALQHLFLTSCSPSILSHFVSKAYNTLHSFQFIAGSNKRIRHKGDICPLVLDSVIGGLQNCKLMVISWRCWQAMKKGMSIIFCTATRLETLRLELEIRFETRTVPHTMEEIFTGLSPEDLESVKHDRNLLYQSGFKTRGIQNLTR